MRLVWEKRIGFARGAAALLLVASATAQTSPPPSPPPPPPSAKTEEPAVNPDDLYKLGQQLFDDYAPADVKAQYEFPSKTQWDAFVTRLQTALQSDSVDDLAEYAPQARALLTALRTAGVEPELSAWLEQRLDEVEGAQEARAQPPPAIAPPRPGPALPGPVRAAPAIPYYDLWVARVRTRPVPARAAELMPTLRSAFVAEGVPPALAWLAEAESSLNPQARSPAGAKGLFQLMPDTAKHLGLDTFLPDERTNPGKSAHAAARYLKELHEKFGSWPLTLAAYNAGEGRVSRALTARHAADYAGIATALPAETRMYVPKVYALVTARTGTTFPTP